PLGLRNSQLVVGQGATGSTLAALLGVTWPADAGPQPAINGTRPSITSSTNDVNLASGNTVRGLTLGNATGSALSGSGFGTLGTAVNVSTRTGGTVTLSGGINPSAAGRGIVASGNSGGTISFTGAAKRISVPGGTHGVSLTSNSGATIEFTNGGLNVASATG